MRLWSWQKKDFIQEAENDSTKKIIFYFLSNSWRAEGKREKTNRDEGKDRSGATKKHAPVLAT